MAIVSDVTPSGEVIGNRNNFELKKLDLQRLASLIYQRFQLPIIPKTGNKR